MVATLQRLLRRRVVCDHSDVSLEGVWASFRTGKLRRRFLLDEEGCQVGWSFECRSCEFFAYEIDGLIDVMRP